RPSITSARPPVLAKGAASEATNKILMVPGKEPSRYRTPICPSSRALRFLQSPCFCLLNWAAMPRQKLGQHFLSDAGWRENIARAIGISRHATLDSSQGREVGWLEIGAGHGEMSKLLLATGQPVAAVELDAALVAHLDKLRESFPNLTVVPGDILKLDLAALLP